ncbi:MAG: hypothetical protein M3N47_11485 [Chloroflexota bacterium]|nr:hypothetical protein [Chloroflexota bacterium]
MTDEFEDHTERAQPWPTDQLTRGAAAFLAQVVGMDRDREAVEELAADLGAIKRDANAAIYSIQLDSNIGPAAFLVYAYLLDERGGDGKTGRELYEAGLATLAEAAHRASPGPRAVAHAETRIAGFILATTPGTYRALQGEPSPGEEPVPDQTPLPPPDGPSFAELNQQRADAAIALLSLLRDANQTATAWLTAIQQTGGADPTGDGDDLLEFNEDETALALFLLDDTSIGDLLKTLNLIVTAAQEQAVSTPRQ